MYLLDTNVVSELRKAKTKRANQSVIAWAKSVSPVSLHLSAITILELQMGILSKARKDSAQAAVLRQWLEQSVLVSFSGRILSLDVPVAMRCAQLHVPDRKSERDAMIAATAIEHGMTLVTRNTQDFKGTKVRLMNPWVYDSVGIEV
jgi:predicted nucleic acid-binding protein